MKNTVWMVLLAAGVIATSCNVSREGAGYDSVNNARTADNPSSDYDRVSSSVSPRSEVEGAYPYSLGNYNQNIVYDTVLGPTTGRNYNDRRGAKENFYEQAGDEKITVF